MVPWWKRLIYSLVSVIIGGGTLGAVASCMDALANPKSHLDLGGIALSAGIFLAFSLPGWIVAIPILMFVKDYSGWRLWACAATGICIGPILILALRVYQFVIEPQSVGFLPGGGAILLVPASAVSVLSTVIYLLLVSRVLKGPIAPKPA